MSSTDGTEFTTGKGADVGQRTGYQPGTFSYIELATPDPDAAKAFYGALFDWEPDDQALPEEAGGGVYTTLRVGGDAVAGVTPQQPDQQAAGVPPYWLSYVTVTDADATADRARELGGQVHAGPFDVMTLGRMAVITDPAGAAFAVWQAGDSIGATRVNDPGCLTSNELSTTDVVGAIAFYTGLFGWQIEEVDTGRGPRYWLINHAGATEGRNGGMRELAQSSPAHRRTGCRTSPPARPTARWPGRGAWRRARGRAGRDPRRPDRCTARSAGCLLRGLRGCGGRLAGQRPIDDRDDVDAPGQRADAWPAVAGQPGGAEGVRHRGGRVPDQQRALQHQRHPLDQPAGARLDASGSASSCRQRRRRGVERGVRAAAAPTSAQIRVEAAGSRPSARSTSSALTLPEPSQIEFSGASR